MRMEAGLDTGPVFATVKTAIDDTDTAGTLTDRLAQLGAELLMQHIGDLAEMTSVPQPEVGSTYAGKLKKEDGQVDWNLSARDVWLRIRAFSPWPSAFTFVNGKRMQILAANLAHDTKANPGAAIIDGTHLFVGCGDGAIELIEVKPEGKRAMNAQDYLVGRPFESGTKLG